MRNMITGIISILCYLQCFGTLSASVTAKNENGNFVLKNKNVELVFANGKEFLFKEFRMDGMNILPEHIACKWKYNTSVATNLSGSQRREPDLNAPMGRI